MSHSQESSPVPLEAEDTVSIPTIDLNIFTEHRDNKSLDSLKERTTIALKLIHSLQEYGAVYIVNHKINDSCIQTTFAEAASFFALPEDTKKLAVHPAGSRVPRGYSQLPPLGRSLTSHPSLTGSTPDVNAVNEYDWKRNESDSGESEHTVAVGNDISPPNGLGNTTADKACSMSSPLYEKAMEARRRQCREMFDIGSETNKAMPNAWLPTGTMPGWRGQMKLFRTTCLIWTRPILHALTMGLSYTSMDNQKRPSLGKVWTGNDDQLRLMRAPLLPNLPNGTDTHGGAASVDTGSGSQPQIREPTHDGTQLAALYFQDAHSGLEIEVPGRQGNPGTWLPVEPREEAIVLIVGDFLERWSSGRLQSPRYRENVKPVVDGGDSDDGDSGNGGDDGDDGDEGDDGDDGVAGPDIFSMAYIISVGP